MSKILNMPEQYVDIDKLDIPKDDCIECSICYNKVKTVFKCNRCIYSCCNDCILKNKKMNIKEIDDELYTTYECSYCKLENEYKLNDFTKNDLMYLLKNKYYQYNDLEINYKIRTDLFTKNCEFVEIMKKKDPVRENLLLDYYQERLKIEIDRRLDHNKLRDDIVKLKETINLLNKTNQDYINKNDELNNKLDNMRDIFNGVKISHLIQQNYTHKLELITNKVVDDIKKLCVKYKRISKDLLLKIIEPQEVDMSIDIKYSIDVDKKMNVLL